MNTKRKFQILPQQTDLNPVKYTTVALKLILCDKMTAVRENGRKQKSN
jgi:hypothetical protein